MTGSTHSTIRYAAARQSRKRPMRTTTAAAATANKLILSHSPIKETERVGSCGCGRLDGTMRGAGRRRGLEGHQVLVVSSLKNPTSRHLNQNILQELFLCYLYRAIIHLLEELDNLSTIGGRYNIGSFSTLWVNFKAHSLFISIPPSAC